MTEKHPATPPPGTTLAKSCCRAFLMSGVAGMIVGGVLSTGGDWTPAHLASAWILAVPALPFLRILPRGVWPLGLPIILAGGLGYALLGAFSWFVVSSIALEVRGRSGKKQQP